jgi:hypothetical protein
MDKLSRLQALLGNDQVEGENDFPLWNHSAAKPKHLYEGTDAEDDEQIITRRVDIYEEASWAPATETGAGKRVFYLVKASFLT